MSGIEVWATKKNGKLEIPKIKKWKAREFHKPSSLIEKPKTYMDYLKEAKERSGEDKRLYKRYRPEF